jgi:hypothetical protein
MIGGVDESINCCLSSLMCSVYSMCYALELFFVTNTTCLFDLFYVYWMVVSLFCVSCVSLSSVWCLDIVWSFLFTYTAPAYIACQMYKTNELNHMTSATHNVDATTELKRRVHAYTCEVCLMLRPFGRTQSMRANRAT